MTYPYTFTEFLGCIDEVIQGAALPTTIDIMLKYVSSLQEETRKLKFEYDEHKASADRAIQLLQERIASLEKDRIDTAAYATIVQRMEKTENENRLLKNLLKRTRYDRDEFLELCRWWHDWNLNKNGSTYETLCQIQDELARLLEGRLE